MLTLLSAAMAITVWEMDEPMDIQFHKGRVRVLKAGDPLIDTVALNDALKSTDCDAYVESAHTKIPANDTCWHFNRPKNCHAGYFKMQEAPLINARVQGAAANVVDGNQVSLVVSNVTYDIQKTKFTVQPEGLFTIPCDGIVSGVIHGAAAAVQGVVDLAAEGVPVLGELSAMPIDGVVADLEHTLDGLCGLIEHLLKDILKILGTVVEELINNVLPDVIQGLLELLVKTVLAPSFKAQAMLAQ